MKIIAKLLYWALSLIAAIAVLPLVILVIAFTYAKQLWRIIELYGAYDGDKDRMEKAEWKAK